MSGYPGKTLRGSDAIQCGLLSPRKLRGGAWRRLFRDIYADARLKPTHKLRCKAALAHLLPDGALIAGRSAPTWSEFHMWTKATRSRS